MNEEWTVLAIKLYVRITICGYEFRANELQVCYRSLETMPRGRVISTLAFREYLSQRGPEADVARAGSRTNSR